MGRSVSRRAPQGGLVGNLTQIPQNDPHDALIILIVHNREKLLRKNLPFSSDSHQPTRDVEVRLGSNFFVYFSPIFEFSTKF